MSRYPVTDTEGRTRLLNLETIVDLCVSSTTGHVYVFTNADVAGLGFMLPGQHSTSYGYIVDPSLPANSEFRMKLQTLDVLKPTHTVTGPPPQRGITSPVEQPTNVKKGKKNG